MKGIIAPAKGKTKKKGSVKCRQSKGKKSQTIFEKKN